MHGWNKIIYWKKILFPPLSISLPQGFEWALATMRELAETGSLTFAPGPTAGPSPPPTPRTQCRVKRNLLRRVRPAQCEQTSDSTSSYAVSVRSGQAISSSASSSLAMSNGLGATSQTKLLTRRMRCETPVPRGDIDELSNAENDNHINAKTERAHTGSELKTPGMVAHELLNDRLPAIGGRRPVSRHVVYSVQYDDKPKNDDQTKSLFERARRTRRSTSLDSPRSLRQEFSEVKAKSLERQLSTLSLPTKPYKDPSPNLNVQTTRSTPNDSYIDQKKKMRILNWLESVEKALLDDSIDTNTLSVIKEE